MFALVNGQVVTGVAGESWDPGVVLVDEGLIVAAHSAMSEKAEAIPEGCHTIDMSGLCVLPGLIDCHVHLFMGERDSARNLDFSPARAREHALAHLRAGVTTVRDLGGPQPAIFDLRDEISKGEVVGPRIIAAGRVVTTPNGHGCFMGTEAATAEEIVSAIKGTARAGADCVKIIVSGGVSTPESDLYDVQYGLDEVRIAVSTAHELGLRVAAHASNPEGIRISAEAGCDSIEHAVLIDDGSLAALAHSSAVVVPTLVGTDRPADFLVDPAIPDFVREKASITLSAHRPSIRRIVDAGVPVATGTDGGALLPHGLVAREVRQLVECGLATADAVAAVTANSAKLLGIESSVGTLSPGKIADLVVLGGNPLTDIGYLNDVRLVFKGGRLVYRSSRQDD